MCSGSSVAQIVKFTNTEIEIISLLNNNQFINNRAATTNRNWFLHSILCFFKISVAIELIVQHIRDFLNNRGRSIDAEVAPIVYRDDLDENSVGTEDASNSKTGTPTHGKKKNEIHSHSMHRPHWEIRWTYPMDIIHRMWEDEWVHFQIIKKQITIND